MSNPGPALEGTVDPYVGTGGVNGTIVANSVTETLGFYGDTGVAKQTGVAVDVASLVTVLENLGLMSFAPAPAPSPAPAPAPAPAP